MMMLVATPVQLGIHMESPSVLDPMYFCTNCMASPPCIDTSVIQAKQLGNSMAIVHEPLREPIAILLYILWRPEAQ